MLRRTKRHLHTLLVVPALVMMLALAGCSGSDDEPAATSEKSTTDAGAGEVPSDAEMAEKSGGNPDRAFGSTDEAVIKAVTAATKAEKVEWDGKVLRVFVEGSIDDPTAGLHCLAVHGVIADDEQGVFVYGDGEFDCETQR